MIEPNDLGKKETQPRARKRKSAAWKSGLMLTGLGAVVAGAGYLAGVNAPAVAQTAAAQNAPRAAATGAGADNNQLVVPSNDPFRANGLNSEEAQGLALNGDDEHGSSGDEGTLQAPNTNGGVLQTPDNRSSGQLNQQFGGRRSRGLRGFNQQQPGFGGPVTRSRGS